MSRADISEKQLKILPNFYLYVDEFQNFVTDAFAGILSEARKYRLNLTIAHQYTAQLISEKNSITIFTNVFIIVITEIMQTPWINQVIHNGARLFPT